MQVIEQYRVSDDIMAVPEEFFGLSHTSISVQDMRLRFRYMTDRLSINISNTLLDFLCDWSEPVLLKVFFLKLYGDSWEIIRMLLFVTGYEKLYDMVSGITVCDQDDLDKTMLFHSFLKELWLKITDRMVSLKNSMRDNDRYASESILKERYPACSREQIKFYVEHRTLHHYYTIERLYGMLSSLP